jgi:methylated-DNA-[protein]-cysteine S-methyltransferase
VDVTEELEQRLRAAAADVRPAAFDAEAFARHAAAEGATDVAYAVVDSPVGQLLVAQSARGLARIAYLDSTEADRVLGDLAARLSPRMLEAPAQLDEVRRELDDYFEGRRRDFGVAVDWTLVGPFGRKVLQRTVRIPYGKTSSYGEIAREIGSPRAARATGNALGANPIPIVVPCHRVLRGTGALGGYTGGLHRKELLLGIERG